MSQNGLLIDNEYCTGCHSCEVACKNEKELPLGQWGIKVLELGPWKRTSRATGAVTSWLATRSWAKPTGSTTESTASSKPATAPVTAMT